MTACPSGKYEAEYKKYPRAELQQYAAESDIKGQFVGANPICETVQLRAWPRRISVTKSSRIAVCSNAQLSIRVRACVVV